MEYPTVDIWPDFVSWEKRIVFRPNHWSISSWIDYWEQVKKLPIRSGRG